MEPRLVDETEPLLHQTVIPVDEAIIPLDDSDIVEFDSKGDEENPLEWPAAYKRGTVALLAFTAFTVTFACVSVVPVANAIVLSLDGVPNKSYSVLLVTIWELGEAFGPLFMAPLSEMYGRYPVIIVANFAFTCSLVLCAMAPSTPVLIFGRFLNGLFVASNVLNPAIVGDIFIPEQRGRAMSLIILAPLIGGAIGPAISGACAETLGWRSFMWLAALLAGTAQLVFLLSFRETYKVIILSRRAAKLRRETGIQTLRTAYDNDKDGEKNRLWESMKRPAVVFASSGVLQAMCICGSINFTFFYIMSTTLPDILQGVYGLSAAQTGSCFLVFSIGSLTGIGLCNYYLDRLYIRHREASKDGIGRPEGRLPLCITGCISLPLVFLAYGWVPQLKLPLSVELVLVILTGTTLLLGFLPVTSFIVDAFGVYAASATTSLMVVRCLMGTLLPLTTAPLIDKLGLGWAFTILSGVALCTAPVPVLIMRYGPQWRQRSKFTKDE